MRLDGNDNNSKENTFLVNIYSELSAMYFLPSYTSVEIFSGDPV